MHTLMVLGAGFVLLAACLLVARLVGGAVPPMFVRGAQVFIPLWLIAAAVNMWFGVSQAGYSVAEEAPMFALVFGVPAAVAGLVWWRYAGR
jgi:hypothetical protein